jgi:hypothetical protein
LKQESLVDWPFVLGDFVTVFFQEEES